MGDFTFLNLEQLRQLAHLLLYQETEAIMNIQFNSEPATAKYLRDCKTSYELAVGLLEDGGELERKWFENENKDRASIAHDIYGYIVNAANHALQTVRNYNLRMNYVKNIREHAQNLGSALEQLDDNEINIRRLAKEATQYRNAMLEFARNHQSPASRQFSKWLKESGIKFEDLVQRYQAKLEFQGPFKDLEDAQKIQVYQEIIEASGRGNITVNALSKAFGVAGIAVLLFAAGMMVWDIFSADHIIQRATYDAVVGVASVGGAMLGEVVGVALSTSLTGVEASAFFVLLAGVTFSLAGAFLLGDFAAWLVDLIFGSGGSATLSTDGHRCYVGPLPDGMVLARQIAHGQPTHNE